MLTRLRKKSQTTGSAVLWLIRIGLTIVAVGIVVFLLNSTIEKSLNLEDMRFYPVAEFVLYSLVWPIHAPTSATGRCRGWHD